MGELKRDIKFFGAAFLVLNAMIGAGIFALPGKVAVNAGLLSPWLFLGVGAVFLTVVLSFAELASYYRKTGGPVLYATDAFGPLAGFGTGWAIFLSRMTAFAANANVMATYLASLHEFFASPVARGVIISIVTIGLTWANVAGVKDGVRTLGVFTFLKVVPLVIMVLLGMQHVTGATLLPGGDQVIKELGDTTLLLIYAYVGFETIAVTAGETSNPRRTLPRALVGTVVGTGVLYFLIVLVFVSVVPAEGYENSTLVDVGRELAGPIGAIAITLAAVFSIGGNLAGSMLAAPRLIYSMADNRMLPSWFARIHPKYSTPDRSIILMGAMALVLGLTGSFVFLAVASTVVRLLGYMICIAAIPMVRRKADEESRKRAFQLPGGYTIPVIGFGICVWMLLHADMQEWIAVGVLLAIGFALYGVEKALTR